MLLQLSELHCFHLSNTGNFIFSAHSTISPATSHYVGYLKAYYSRTLVPPEIPEHPTFPPAGSKIYINLALVKKEDISQSQADAFTKATLHGNIDEIRRMKEQIHLEDVFKPEGQTSLKYILVEGAPGVGKSTLAWELCQRWDVMAAMRRFSLVVLLRLREKRVQEARTVADLFYHDDSTLQEAVACEVVANNGLNTLLILDGFDEYPSHLRKASLVAEIIQGTCLPNCTVLVTSRPSARADLLFVQSQTHKHIEVLGFTQKHIEEYACSVLGSDKQLLSDFLTYISTNQTIRNIMYVPLNCAIVVNIYQENRMADMPIPQTMTQLYADLSHSLLRNYLTEKGDTRAVRLPQKLEDLQPNLRIQLMNLARFAFEGVVREKVIFSDLPEGLGFVNETEELYCSNSPTTYNFHHLTLQEFLGALYVSMLPLEPVNERMKAFEQHSNKKQMDVLWRFVAGLTSFRGIGWEVVQAKRGQKKDGKVTPFLIQCLYEAQEEAANESVLGTGEVVFKGAGSMSPVDCFALGHCIAASKCVWELMLDWNGMGAEMVEMLMYGMKSKKEVGGCIRKLDLSFNPIQCEGVAYLTIIQPPKVLQQLSELNLQFCELDTNAPNLLSTIIPDVMTSLRMLNISMNRAGAGGMAKLLTSLSSLSSFHTLIMHNTSIARDDLTALSQLIRPTGSLRTLWIGDEGMPAEYTELMMKTVLSPSSLTELAIFGLDLTSCYAVFTFLEDNSNLTWLTTHFCKIGSHGTSCLANALHKNTTLKTLQLFMLQVPLSGLIGTEGALALSKMLKINSSLEWLRIDADNSLGYDGIGAILSSIQDNSTLKELPSSLYIRRTIH